MSAHVRGAFGQVMRPGTSRSPLSHGTPPVPTPAANPGSTASRSAPPAVRAFTDYVGEFIETCRAAIEVAFGEPVEDCPVLPDVATPAPLPTLLAYLLYVAATAPDDEDPARLADWLAHVERSTWTRLGFDARPPQLQLTLAFSLIRERAHQAPELHGLIALVEFLAGADLLRGVRS